MTTERPLWLWIAEADFRRMSSAKQKELVGDAVRAAPKADRSDGRNVSSRWQQIKSAREAYWREPKPEKPSAPARSLYGPGHEPLSADEINRWLQTLPPAPLA
jgi:hypothetical protein